MADPFIREREPAIRTAGAAHRSVRVSETMDGRAAEYQAEIERLKADMARLAQSVGGSVRDSVRPMARELEATVARHPTASVAVAAGLGLVLGFFMTRK